MLCDEKQRPVKAGTEALRNEVIGLPGCAALRVGAGVCGPESHGQDRRGQDEEHGECTKAMGHGWRCTNRLQRY